MAKTKTKALVQASILFDEATYKAKQKHEEQEKQKKSRDLDITGLGLAGGNFGDYIKNKRNNHV